MEYPIRINRYLALNKYSTRKGADELIKKGFVFINGKKAVLGDKVEKNDKVKVSNKAPKKNYVYYAYNKPTKISTNKDSIGKDILSVTKFPTKVFPIGRLDKDSHGLLIMTNDGRVTDRLLSPKYIHEKEYIVKLDHGFSDAFLELLQAGVKFDKQISRKCKASRIDKRTFSIILTEGKKRQIRRMCEALHHEVVDLQRVRIMNINLNDITLGRYKEIKKTELNEFLKLLKLV